MTSITVDRTSLTLPALVLPESCELGPGMWLGEELVKPVFTPRYTYAPDSQYIAGRQMMGVVKEQGMLTFVVYTRAADDAALGVLKAEIEAAFWQFTYTVTFNDGVAATYVADPAIPNWGVHVPAHERMKVARGILSVPINPIGAP